MVFLASFKYPVTKQLRNRLLEPFVWQTVIVTATEFENFFALRAHKDAEIHIEKLAQIMLEKYNNSKPKLLKIGEWHIPFGDIFDESRVLELAKTGLVESPEEARRKIAIARCARVSYLNFEGKDDYFQDLETCNKLFYSIPRHCSPMEHVAMALDSSERIGNFNGFKQYRYLYSDQNLTDSRVLQN